MTIIFSAVLIVALAACWVANIFFLQDYYIKNKLMAIKEAYEYMDEASKANNLSGEKFLAGLRTICETDNISLFVMDQNGRARLTSVHDSEELQRDLYEYVLGIRPNQKSILAENDQYLMSVNRDSPNGGYLKMAGVLRTFYYPDSGRTDQGKCVFGKPFSHLCGKYRIAGWRIYHPLGVQTYFRTDPGTGTAIRTYE